MSGFTPDLFNYYYYENAFSSDEIEKVKELAAKRGGTDGTVGSGDVVNSMRTSELRWFPRENPEYDWLYQKLLWYVNDANDHMWKFKLDGLREPAQFTTYYGHNEGKYHYHTDCGSHAIHRKVSLTVQLSDSDEYEGGNLEFLMIKDPITAPRKKGAMVVFPSYVLHRVTPVTSGRRDSLVLWAAGPPFV